MVYDSNWALLEDYTFPGTTIPAWLGSPYSGSTGQLPAGDWEPSLVTVSGGYLNLMTDGTNSAGIASNGSPALAMTYGRIEVTAYADADPALKGGVPCIGLWPVSQNWPTEIEIDMIEMPNTWAGLAPNPRPFISVSDNYGIYEPWGLPYGSIQTLTELLNGSAFNGAASHVYACECMPQGMTCWIDGEVMLQVTGPTIAIPWTPHNLFMQYELIDNMTSSSGLGLHVSEVKFFAANGPSAIGGPNRFVMVGGTRYRK